VAAAAAIILCFVTTVYCIAGGRGCVVEVVFEQLKIKKFIKKTHSGLDEFDTIILIYIIYCNR
jgi:hypothetical protein